MFCIENNIIDCLSILSEMTKSKFVYIFNSVLIVTILFCVFINCLFCLFFFNLVGTNINSNCFSCVINIMHHYFCHIYWGTEQHVCVFQFGVLFI